ncbi:uncharacterized protein LOC134823832 isoform X1 [Bolinopsis microptera]|uniref:uncharacterized protein LOC134823832 isoform X1 n=1 Tax=Bolinopsis microptera TaxID=2820187 RepID=UPI00307A93CD
MFPRRIPNPLGPRPVRPTWRPTYTLRSHMTPITPIPVSPDDLVRGTQAAYIAAYDNDSIRPVKLSPHYKNLLSNPGNHPSNQLSHPSNQLSNPRDQLSNPRDKLGNCSNTSDKSPKCNLKPELVKLKAVTPKGNLKPEIVKLKAVTPEARVFEGDQENGMNVIKRKRQFGGSLRFKRANSVLVSHPTADDSMLSKTRDDNDVTREIPPSRDKSRSNSYTREHAKSRDSTVADLKRDNEKINKKYNTSFSKFISKNLTSKSRSLGRPDPLSRKNAKLDEKLRTHIKNKTISPIKAPTTATYNVPKSLGRPSVLPPKVTPSLTKSPTRPPQITLQSAVKPNLPSPIIHYNHPSFDDVINKRDDVIGNGADYTRDDNNVTSCIDDTVLYTPINQTTLAFPSPQSVGRSGEGQNGDVRKWGSCSRLEYNGQPGYGHYPVPGHERTEGDGGPASYPEPYNNQYTEPAYNPYNRRHSSSKMSSHSNNSDEVILAQKAELEEKNRVIESLKMRMTDGDSKLTERAYSDKSGEHGAVAESLDSGIDIRSETGVMKPLFGGQRTSSDERNELAKLRLYVKQLEAKVDSGVSSSYEEESKVENLLKDNQKLIDEKTSISRKFARLQDYLTTLPTVNEYTKLQEQLTQLTEENTNLQEEQKRVTESSKDVKLKDADMKKYQKKCTDMRESIMKLEKQNNLLKSQNANQAKQELQKVELEKSKMEKKMEQLKKEISVLSEQKESTKSLVGGYYEKFNNEQEKTKILTQSLENSVNEVEDLRSELDRRIHQEEELQGRISDLERELEAVLLKMEEYESQENRDVENSELLMAEYNAAFQDLNSVVEVCQMRVQGQQLDISLLLGLGASPRPSNKEDLTVESQLRNIQALRSNIENIRTLLSDLYAEDIGSQCPTQ